MNTEQQARELLARAAELPDDIAPPLPRLIRRARRKRAWRAGYAVVTVAVVAAAAFAVPQVIRVLGPGGLTMPGTGSLAGLFPTHPVRVSPGPAAAQLSGYRWTTMHPSPLGPRSQPLLAWTGRELLELGGYKKGSSQQDGAAFTPATGRWRLVPSPPGNVGFTNAVDVWTGHQLFVTNGQFESCPLAPGQTRTPAMCWPHAGLYDPAANHWSFTRLPVQMYGLTLTSAVWTGRVVILAGVNPSPKHPRLGVAAYDPATGRWRMITPALPSDHPPADVAMVATPSRILLWFLWSRTEKSGSNSYAVYSGIDVLSLGRAGGWQPITGTWPQHKTVDSPVYSGGQIFLSPAQIWCGLCSHPGLEFPARLVNPASLARSTVPNGPLVPHPGIQPGIWLWNGRAALAANTGSNPLDQGPGPPAWLTQLAAFDPATNRWTMLPVPSGKPPIAANPIWASQALLLLTSSGALLSFHS